LQQWSGQEQTFRTRTILNKDINIFTSATFKSVNMGSKTVFHLIETKKTLSDVKQATKQACSFLGGTIYERGDGFEINQGVNGVNFAFSANLKAYININQTDPEKYQIIGTINWNPNGVFWACLIIGFFVFGILWIIPLLYLFIDPTSAYQQALFRIPNFLE
jgi:hypothetical protein